MLWHRVLAGLVHRLELPRWRYRTRQRLLRQGAVHPLARACLGQSAALVQRQALEPVQAQLAPHHIQNPTRCQGQKTQLSIDPIKLVQLHSPVLLQSSPKVETFAAVGHRSRSGFDFCRRASRVRATHARLSGMSGHLPPYARGAVTAAPALLDARARPLRDLRVSVTDRCNFRCRYCMPRETVAKGSFLQRAEILRFEEIVRIAQG